MLDTEAASLAHEFGSHKSCQKYIGWFFNHQAETTLCLTTQEVLDLLYDLNAVFDRHLKVEDEHVDWLEDFTRLCFRRNRTKKVFLEQVDHLLSVERVPHRIG